MDLNQGGKRKHAKYMAYLLVRLVFDLKAA